MCAKILTTLAVVAALAAAAAVAVAADPPRPPAASPVIAPPNPGGADKQLQALNDSIARLERWRAQHAANGGSTADADQTIADARRQRDQLLAKLGRPPAGGSAPGGPGIILLGVRSETASPARR